MSVHTWGGGSGQVSRGGGSGPAGGGQVQPGGGSGPAGKGGSGPATGGGGGSGPAVEGFRSSRGGGVSILRPLAGSMPLAFTQEDFLVDANLANSTYTLLLVWSILT